MPSDSDVQHERNRKYRGLDQFDIDKDNFKGPKKAKYLLCFIRCIWHINDFEFKDNETQPL